MSKLSDDKTLSLAIRHAITDRNSLVEAYCGEGDWAESARKDAASFALLQDKRMSEMSSCELLTVRSCLIFAQQGLEGYAWANHGRTSVEGRRALILAGQIGELRLRLGKKLAADSVAL